MNRGRPPANASRSTIVTRSRRESLANHAPWMPTGATTRIVHAGGAVGAAAGGAVAVASGQKREPNGAGPSGSRSAPTTALITNRCPHPMACGRPADLRILPPTGIGRRPPAVKTAAMRARAAPAAGGGGGVARRGGPRAANPAAKPVRPERPVREDPLPARAGATAGGVAEAKASRDRRAFPVAAAATLLRWRADTKKTTRVSSFLVSRRPAASRADAKHGRRTTTCWPRAACRACSTCRAGWRPSAS